MARVIFDTNAYTLFKSENPEDALDIVEFADEIYMPIVVMGELYAGFYGGNKLEANLVELESFLALPNTRVLDLSANTTKIFGELFVKLKSKGITVPHNDLWIASLAVEFESVVYSLDKHLKMIEELEVIEVIQSFENLLEIDSQPKKK
jgi:tRNA(fMet)-specific endonuclease VapC